MGESRKVFEDLLERRRTASDDVAATDQKIWKLFGETWAILCSDMSGFTRRTEQFGILHFLTLIHEMHLLMRPVILKHNGLLLKEEADNLFVIFREPKDAARCALAMHGATRRFNREKTADGRIDVCVGLGYGEVLKIGDEDCFGGEVNRSFKLGEDIAAVGETLLTSLAYEAMHALEGVRCEKVFSNKSGLFSHYYRLIDERTDPD